MEPRIQYAKTKDGVSIAFWTMGEGMPLLHASGWNDDLELWWEHPDGRGFRESTAHDRLLVNPPRLAACRRNPRSRTGCRPEALAS